jgi:anthranilate synthase/aminodeoxychorismate synthase-like glutamine amidotransferase
MLVLIDNYDSFTYNLVQRIGELDASRPMRVYRNDQVTLEQLDADHPTHLIVSPGPGRPEDGGISNDAIRHFAGKIPVLGVCLGHQCMGQVFGATVVRAQRLMHGKTSLIAHDGRTIFAGLSDPFQATRYHSLIVDRSTLSSDFEVTAWTTDQEELMGIRHRTWPLEGVQFHPESFLTTEGHKLLANFLKM